MKIHVTNYTPMICFNETNMGDKMQRIFCVTVYVIDDQKRFLLLHHRKLNKWVPPGGKIDPHETPDEAAVRECFEETGLEIELIGETTPVEGGLMKPYGVQHNVIIPGEKDHVDLIYLAKQSSQKELTISEREAYDIGWYTIEEMSKLDTFGSVISWCKIFIDMKI